MYLNNCFKFMYWYMMLNQLNCVALNILHNQPLKNLHCCVIIWNKRANTKITEIHCRRITGSSSNKLKQYVEIMQQNLLLQILESFRAFAQQSKQRKMWNAISDCWLLRGRRFLRASFSLLCQILVWKYARCRSSNNNSRKLVLAPVFTSFWVERALQ